MQSLQNNLKHEMNRLEAVIGGICFILHSLVSSIWGLVFEFITNCFPTSALQSLIGNKDLSGD